MCKCVQRGIVRDGTVTMEGFLDDIAAEVEVNPDDEAVSVKENQAAKKKALLDMLSGVASSCSGVVSAVITVVTKEDHIHLYKEREMFWTSLHSAQSMSTLVKGLIHVY